MGANVLRISGRPAAARSDAVGRSVACAGYAALAYIRF